MLENRRSKDLGNNLLTRNQHLSLRFSQQSFCQALLVLFLFHSLFVLFSKCLQNQNIIDIIVFFFVNFSEVDDYC